MGTRLGNFALATTCAMIAVALLAVAASSAPTVRQDSPAIDVEIAVDTTGSMDDSIQSARDLGDKLVAGVAAVAPNAHFAIVSFRDPGNPGGEYQVLQPMTSDTNAVAQAISQLHTVHNPSPKNVSEESYNLAFHNSYTGTGIGWRAEARKLVVVIGDAEPYGAGAAGLAGCTNTLVDPHGFDTAHELAGMKAAGRTLLFVRAASGGTTVSLPCYKSMAARTSAAGAAVNDTDAGDLSISVLRLVETSLAPVVARTTPILVGAGGATRVSIRVVNPNAFPMTVQTLTLAPSAGFTAGALTPGWSAGAGGMLTATPQMQLASGQSLVTSLTLRAPGTARTAGTVTASIALPDGKIIAPKSEAATNAGHAFVLRLRPQTRGGAGAAGAVTLKFSQPARGLKRGVARGTITVSRRSARWQLSLAGVSVVQTPNATSLTLTGKWGSGAGCQARPGRLRLTLTVEPVSGQLRAGYLGATACASSPRPLSGTSRITVTPSSG